MKTSGPNVTQVRKGLTDTQVKSTRGRAASTVFRQGDRDPRKGRDRLDPVSGPQVGVGRNLAHSNTRNSPGVQYQGEGRSVKDGERKA